MVNWCPALGTVLANDEVVDGVSERGGFPVVQKKMKQWCLRVSAYSQRLLDGLERIDWTESLKETQRNWIGRSEGTEMQFRVKDSDIEFTIFTTRADTIFGANCSTRSTINNKKINFFMRQLVTACKATCYLNDIRAPLEKRLC